MVERRPIARVTGRSRETTDDAVAVERALEIRVDGRALSVTLRTPGHDEELALGFLASEGVLHAAADVAGLASSAAARDDESDVLDVQLASGVVLDWTKLERNFAATAACGICGRAQRLCPVRDRGCSRAARTPSRFAAKCPLFQNSVLCRTPAISLRQT